MLESVTILASVLVNDNEVTLFAADDRYNVDASRQTLSPRSISSPTVMTRVSNTTGHVTWTAVKVTPNDYGNDDSDSCQTKCCVLSGLG